MTTMFSGQILQHRCHCKQSFAPLLLPRCQRTVSLSRGKAAWAGTKQQRVQALSRRVVLTKAAADTEAKSAGSGSKGEDETYEVFIQKPLGIRFGRGKDAGAYVTRVDKSAGNIDERIEVGDKLVQVSASFGDDVWEAGKFGQCMYAIKTRNGDLYFRFKKMYGDLTSFDDVEETEAEAQFRKERAGGNYGGGTKELQLMNFKKRQEQDARRNGLFESGLDKFYKKEIQGALYDFEEVIAMEKKQPSTPREFATVSSLYRVSHYNVACCYAAIDQVDAGLEALDTCLKSGFDQFGKVRSDPNLETLRKSPKFTELIDRFDEPVIDTNIFKKAYRLGKWLQNVNKVRKQPMKTQMGLLELLSNGGEAVYYFVEQLTWLVKAGLLGKEYAHQFSQISAWAEVVGYCGSSTLNCLRIRASIEREAALTQDLLLRRQYDDTDKERLKAIRSELAMLQARRFLRTLAVIQDIADALLTLPDLGEGSLAPVKSKAVLAFAGLVSAAISIHKNWPS